MSCLSVKESLDADYGADLEVMKYTQVYVMFECEGISGC